MEGISVYHGISHRYKYLFRDHQPLRHILLAVTKCRKESSGTAVSRSQSLRVLSCALRVRTGWSMMPYKAPKYTKPTGRTKAN